MGRAFGGKSSVLGRVWPTLGAMGTANASRLEQDRVLLLARVPFGESSLVVQLFARDRGRVHLIARGAYRANSGYAGLLDLFDSLELSWHRAGQAHGALGELRAGALAVRRKHLAQDLASYGRALGVLELLDLAARVGPGDRALFERAEAALDELDFGATRRLDDCVAVDPELVALRFDLEFLGALGLAPALDRCASCGRQAPLPGTGLARTAFAPAAGGRLCQRCAAHLQSEGMAVWDLESALLEAAAALLAARDREALWALGGLPAPSPRADSQAEAHAGTLLTGGPGSSGRKAPAATLSGPRLAALGDWVDRFLEHHLETRPKSRGARRRHAANSSLPNAPHRGGPPRPSASAN
ncbi:MAG: DNA repair protein RecO [Planctomycetaceae bacterium]|nr:DNA repair protein RecO [Planctomycetaceae bacterium]